MGNSYPISNIESVLRIPSISFSNFLFSILFPFSWTSFSVIDKNKKHTLRTFHSIKRIESNFDGNDLDIKWKEFVYFSCLWINWNLYLNIRHILLREKENEVTSFMFLYCLFDRLEWDNWKINRGDVSITQC